MKSPRKSAKTASRTAAAVAASGPLTPEVVPVRTRRLACDGGGGALGHPRVYLEMGEEDFVECGYCDRRFVLSHELPEDEALAPGTYEGAAGH